MTEYNQNAKADGGKLELDLVPMQGYVPALVVESKGGRMNGAYRLN